MEKLNLMHEPYLLSNGALARRGDWDKKTLTLQVFVECGRHTTELALTKRMIEEQPEATIQFLERTAAELEERR